MIISECFADIPFQQLNHAQLPRQVTGIQCDSRRVQAGEIFVCIRGAKADGRLWAQEAVKKGCCAVVTDCPGHYFQHISTIPVILTDDVRRTYAKLCRNFYGRPDQYLITVGVTGTKGKTSTGWMIYEILKTAGRLCGFIGTIGVVTGDQVTSCNNTTPESGQLYQIMYHMVESGYTHLVMEVSSQALMQHRVEGITFDFGVFLNLSPDHIQVSEHHDLEEYRYWKASLFLHTRHGICWEHQYQYVKALLKGRGAHCQMVSFGASPEADYYLEPSAVREEPGLSGLTFSVIYQRGKRRARQKLRLTLFGEYQAENATAAFACTREMGCALIHQKTGLFQTQIPGRGEFIYRGEFSVMIDYAHNGESLSRLLEALRAGWHGEIFCVFGCGGNRSRERRFDMGRVSGLLADETIFTEDNSREENLDDILADLCRGIRTTSGRYRVIPDRYQAIFDMILEAEPGRLLVFAGKGHENYMERRGKRFPFSERSIIEDAIHVREKRTRQYGG